MYPKKIISPALQKIIEMTEKIEKSISLGELLSKQTMFDHILRNSTIMSVAKLRNQKTGIAGIMQRSSEIAKLKVHYPETYFENLLTHFPGILDETELEVAEFDFFPDENAGEVKVYQEVPKLERIIGDIYLDNNKIFDLHPRDFEELVAEILKKNGWEVKLTKQTRDNGYDILAIQEISGFNFKLLAEVKRWAASRKVDVAVIRGFQSVVINEQANKGVIFTSSTFSRDAIKYKDNYNPHLIDLKDYNDIIKWISDNKHS